MFPHAVAEEFRARDHDAVAVFELNLQGTPDEEVFDLAVNEDRVVVTENFADFAALVERRQATDEPCTPVVFVRKSSLPTGGALAAHLAERLDGWAADNPDPYPGLHWP
jgi:predicted nuclease of predicted toxin-antitoxin system